MLRLETKLDNVDRFSREAADDVIASGVTGSFVAIQGDKLEFPTAGDLGVVQIFTESYRDGTAGKWSTDVEASGFKTLSVISGKYRGLTDQYVGTPTAGQKLKVDAEGKLTGTSVTSNTVAAVCTKAPHTSDHLDKDTTVIEFITV